MDKLPELLKTLLLGDQEGGLTATYRPGHFPDMPNPQPAYYAKAARVVDGDTVTLTVSKWFGVSEEMKIRLAGINAPEKNTLEGKQAEAFTRVWFAASSTASAELYPFVVLITGPDKYGGRWDGFVYNSMSGDCINQLLIDNDLAEEYPKRKV